MTAPIEESNSEPPPPVANSDQVIDLRSLQFSSFTSSSPATPQSKAFLELRTQRMREYGWRDIPAGQYDHDSYDDLGGCNVSVVLETESGELLAGTRITQCDLPFVENASVAMWGPTPDAILNHQPLQDLHADGLAVDNTRLLLSDSGRPEHILILLGAGFEATDRRVSPFFTITESLHRFIQTIDLHMTIVHEGTIGGERCIFGFFTPERIFSESGPAAVALLELGRELASEAPLIFAAGQESVESDLAS